MAWLLFGFTTILLASDRTFGVTLLSQWDITCGTFLPLIISNDIEEEVSSENCNAFFNKNHWTKQPKISFPHAMMDATYSILCLDPDAPGHGQDYYYLHMAFANIPGADLANGNLSGATILSEYVKPTPPKDSGIHRYMFVLYQHTNPQSRINIEIKSRAQFNLKNWLSSTDLTGPVAGIQFRSTYNLLNIDL